jgi:hypothetical protein
METPRVDLQRDGDIGMPAWRRDEAAARLGDRASLVADGLQRVAN